MLLVVCWEPWPVLLLAIKLAAGRAVILPLLLVLCWATKLGVVNHNPVAYPIALCASQCQSLNSVAKL
jgi:hypothetical protein